MGAVTETQPRIAALDIIRGVAVMGILAMNIVAFAMPFAAYTNPTAAGGAGTADLVSWALSFVVVDGKMRGLFTLLFGASMLLVIERAEAAGAPSEKVHFRRMGWLLLFGLAHFYFIWWGDILSLYAPAGMIAWFFWDRPMRALIGWGAALIGIQFVVFAGLSASYFEAAAAAAGGDAAAVEAWRSMKSEFAPGAAELAADRAVHGAGSYPDLVLYRLTDYLWDPVISLLFFGPETVGYVLLGMAALKSGFIAGTWSDRAYRRVAGWAFGISVPLYGAMAFMIWRSGFDVPVLVAVSLAASILARPLMGAGYVALILLLTRSGGRLVARIAAAGRAAFTNYLGTSLVMTFVFYGYGLGLYGRLDRAELWLVVLPAWLLMLLWSKPWLDRFRYGPIEWLWRSLARGTVQPMRRA